MHTLITGCETIAARITLKSALRDIVKELDAIENETCLDRIKSRNLVWRRAKFLYDNEIDILVQVANNEQKGYSSADIGFPTIPMKTKKETGERQTADYVVYWKWKSEPDDAYRKMGIIFERKEVQDFHNTMIHNYDRFDREMERFITDKKTKMMYVLVEGSRQEAMVFVPPNRRYSGDNIKHMIAAKMGAVASIQARGIHVCWQGSRKASANSIKGYVSHFFEKNIDFVLRDEFVKIKVDLLEETKKEATPKKRTRKKAVKDEL